METPGPRIEITLTGITELADGSKSVDYRMELPTPGREVKISTVKLGQKIVITITPQRAYFDVKNES